MIEDASAAVPLSTLRSGAEACLHDTALDGDTRDLLRSLGLTDASRLRVCKSGDPFIIEVRATRIGVSSAVARQIYVVADAAPPAVPAAHGTHRSGL